jgi:uncharacterized protein YhfF
MIDDRNVHVSVTRYWDAFEASARAGHAEYAVLQFGDGPELAAELAAQVVLGKKRATTSLLRDLTENGKRMLKPGDLCVVVDGKNTPCCIVRILRVDIKPLRDVDEDFAWNEGGGDGSLAWWRKAHERYFKRQGAREGFAVDDATEVILARFEVVWPLKLAKLR